MFPRVLFLLAAVAALGVLLSPPAIVSGAAPGEAKSRVRAFEQDLSDHAGGRSSDSPAKRQGSAANSARTASAYLVATKLVPQKGDGVVYRRTDRNGGKPYVGQSKNESRFRARQQEHARGNPYSDFRYEVLGREAPGAQLERMEEYFIRQLGGPTNLRNPFGGIANRRHQMRYRRYDDAGGGY